MSNNIAAVAARIQERALQLSKEQAALVEAEATLERAKKTLEHETRENVALKREMLNVFRRRDGAELEWMDAEERVETLEKRVAELRRATERAEEAHARMHARWEHAECEIYAAHEVKRELVRRREEGKRARCEERRKRRRDELEALRETAARANEEAREMHREREEIQKFVRELDECEEREDEEMAGLAMQIKATLAKRASLRLSLEDAQQQHAEANAYMLRCEKERMMMITR